MPIKYKTIATSLTVNVQGSSADESISAEIDGRSEACGGLNKGKTNFRPGDNYWFLVFAPKDATGVTVAFCTTGSASIVGTTAYEKPFEEIDFDNSDEAKLSRWALSGFSYHPLGNESVGAVRLDPNDSITLIASQKGYGSGYASYATLAHKGMGTIPADYNPNKKPAIPIKLFITAQVPDLEGCGG